MACLGDLLHGFKQVATSVRDRRHPRSIKATSVLQLVLGVEAEEIGCALSVIGACNFLGRVDNIRKREAVLGEAPVSLGIMAICHPDLA
jgi:hypothetical protein